MDETIIRSGTRIVNTQDQRVGVVQDRHSFRNVDDGALIKVKYTVLYDGASEPVELWDTVIAPL